MFNEYCKTNITFSLIGVKSQLGVASLGIHSEVSAAPLNAAFNRNISLPEWELNQNLTLFWRNDEINGGTITQTGIACKKIPIYMRKSACRWCIVENAKITWSYGKKFWNLPGVKNADSRLVYANRFSSISGFHQC